MRALAICVAVFMSVSVSALAAETDSPVGRKVADFELKDFRGHAHQLSSFADNQQVVIVYLGTECPLAKLYAPRLAQLAEEYGPKGVKFLGINANRQDSITEIGSYARRHGITFPILKDVGNKVADQMGAIRTPEVFLLDQDRVVRYWGRIDDQYGVGYVRDEATRRDLVMAMDQLLAGEAIEQPASQSVGCYIGRVREADTAAEVTYSNQIARILQKRCVECHRDGEIAPFALRDYDEVAGWAETMAEVIRDRRMPPWHADPSHGEFSNDRSMPEEEKEMIYQWVEQGAPEGDPADLPEPQTYLTGWSLPKEPDFVTLVQDEPYTVPAEGEVEYKYFRVDPGFEEDRWVTTGQILPGSSAVVHHVLCFVRPPGVRGDDLGANGIGFLAAYVPGYRPTPLPRGMAKHVPAGSELIFQVHYTPVGSVQHDQCKMGLVFADPSEITHKVETISTMDRGIAIPPHEANYRSEATSLSYANDMTLLSLSPHMHLRGKAFRYELVHLDGQREVLLDVPQYDFNWQTTYELSEPSVLPAGVKIHCVAYFDNSEENLVNPDPTATVYWGDQTWDEMMIGFYDVAVAVDGEQIAKGEVPKLEPVIPPATQRAEQLLSQFDRNEDGVITKDEMPEQGRRFFDFLDRNDSGDVDLDEVVEMMRQREGSRRERRRGDGD